MRSMALGAGVTAIIAAAAQAQTPVPPPPLPATQPPAAITPPPTPASVIDSARAEEWRAIPADDLLIMELAPDGQGRERRIIIQLMPAPFSEAWTSNIRTLARAHWWDGLAVVRVQDNYVTQWGDPNGDEPGRARTLPLGLRPTSQTDYLTNVHRSAATAGGQGAPQPPIDEPLRDNVYGQVAFSMGWPVGYGTDSAGEEHAYPVHCYGMVGVGRDLPPNAGTGAELYTVIGHAPRHLDANIALVGRVIEGMQHLSSLPRGTGPLGFYETPEQRTAIRSVRLASTLPPAEQPRFQYLSTDSQSFGLYAHARANRRDPFFVRPGGGTDVCNIPVPVRRVVQP